MSKEAQWQKIAEQLTAALQTEVTWGSRYTEQADVSEGNDGYTFMPVINEQGLWVKGQLTSREQNLLSLLITERWDERTMGHMDTPRARLLSWLRDVDHLGRIPSEKPDFTRLTLGERVPFTIVTEGAQHPLPEAEVRQVLTSFFDGQVWVLPVGDRSTFILPSAAIIYEGDAAEGWQETLWNWAEGLVELFASELGEDVRAVVHPPVDTVFALGEAWLQSKQALLLGDELRPRQHVLATWDMALEQLLDHLPEEARRTFLDEVAADSHAWWRDVEIRETLEMFFYLNLNVSETARQLFLHRNTLIYRLDKLKQETGKDVRQFTDAMLIRLALLLTAREL